MTLAEWRKTKGVKQRWVADRLGVGTVTVSRWETGTRIPDYQLMREIYSVTAGDVAPNDWILNAKG